MWRKCSWSRPFSRLTAATILNAVSNGYSFHFDILDITAMPGGTVCPVLRRLEEPGHLRSELEKEARAHAELRPRRKYEALVHGSTWTRSAPHPPTRHRLIAGDSGRPISVIRFNVPTAQDS